jgi:hypothetical protein
LSIYLRTGKPGHGKSYGAVRLIAQFLEKGLYVASNIELEDGWEYELARRPLGRRFRRRRVEGAAQRFRDHYYVTQSLDEFGRLRLPPCGECGGCKKGRRCRREGRGVMVLDEAHNWLNARTWDADESGETTSRAQAVQKRQNVNRLFSQHRKLGWHMYLIAQDESDIDKQVRNKFEYHTHLKNMKRWRPYGIPLFPFNYFIEITTWHDARQTRLGVRTYFLDKKVANLFDTMATSHGLSYDDANIIRLGVSDWARGVDPGPDGEAGLDVARESAAAGAGEAPPPPSPDIAHPPSPPSTVTREAA